jgi:ribosomal protein S18 acetylase RimI-like enzyme
MGEPLIEKIKENDLPEVVRIHLGAFPQSAMSVMGGETVRRYYAWQMNNSPHALMVGLFDETGMRGFCFAGPFRMALIGFLRKNLGYLIWRVVSHPRLLLSDFFLVRIGYAVRVIFRRPDKNKPSVSIAHDSFGILSIAVSPEDQGKGYGRRLIRFAEDFARASGHGNMHLTVAPDNSQAVHFYEREGWSRLCAADNVWRGTMVKKL